MYFEKGKRFGQIEVKEDSMGCCYPHHHGPCWGPYRYPYPLEPDVYPRRRRRRADEVGDLQDHLRGLESEIAFVRQQLEQIQEEPPD
jgi:hypothetical protein